MSIKAACLLAFALWGSTTSTDSCAQEAPSLLESFKAWKPILDARMRAEFVDQTPLAEDADALTFRLRAGFESGKVWNTTLLADGDFLTPLDGDYRPDPARPTRTAFPVVADPESYEVNRLQLTNTTLPGTTLTLGRQRILLDDQRFLDLHPDLRLCPLTIGAERAPLRLHRGQPRSRSEPRDRSSVHQQLHRLGADVERYRSRTAEPASRNAPAP